MNKLLFLSLGLCLALIFNGCKSDSKIVGKWGFTNVEQQITDPAEKPMTEADKQVMIEKATYTFNSDMTYEMDLVGSKFNGKWFISENGKVLNMESNGDRTNRDVATISYLTSNTMQLIIQHGVGFTMILSLKRIN